MATNFLSLRSVANYNAGGSTITDGAIQIASTNQAHWTTTLMRPLGFSTLTGSTLTSDRMTIGSTLSVSSMTASGNVGMGTDTPATRLHVNGTVTATTYTAPAGNWLAITNGAGSGRIDLQAGNILMQNANVGIGTTVPAYPLDVSGDARCRGDLYIGTNGTAFGTKSSLYFGGQFGDSAYDHAVIESRAYVADTEKTELLIFKGNDTSPLSGYDRIRLRAAGIAFDTYPATTVDRTTENIRMYITEAGNVGIGTTTPGYTLHVQGAIYASGEITGLSDQRYKKDIEPLTDSLSKVSQLQGVSYRHLDQETDKTHMGLLAQEVAEVYPDTVSYDEKNDRYSLNYISLIAPMIESIKALKAEVETLKSELRELRGV
jgi:hypothetical protein